MGTIGLYGLTLALLAFSWVKDPKRTRASLGKAWKSFENILPQLLTVLLVIGLMLRLLTPDMIAGLIGEESGLQGMAIAAAVGSVTLIPGFIAFPLAAALLKSGAGFTQIALFVSTLMMVGLVTLPVEIGYFGKKATILRNSLAFGASVAVALLIGWVLR